MNHLNSSSGATSTMKKLVGRLRGNSLTMPSSPPNEGEVSSSSRAPSFRIRTPRLSRSPDLQHSPSAKKRHGKNGHYARDAHLALELWNAAYDALRDEGRCFGLVLAYENIISQELPDHLKIGGLNSSFRGKSANQRLDLLTAITAAGLGKRRGLKDTHADDMVKVVLDVARDQVESVVPAYRAASVAWPGLCTLTPLLLEPVVNRESFRKGLLHVVGRIPWYMHLAQLLLASSWEVDQRFREQKNETREKLVRLYRKVLEFEMNCVCATASAWNTAAKNVVGWSTMDKLVNSILDLDRQVVQIVETHCAEGIRSTLLHQCSDLDMGSEAAGESPAVHPLRTTQVAT
ncbi:hypothetical protein ED733_005369 [Metarhizium rileyi]|uniref:NWD NACHT-NTPase N-terminal domain-containing protein n=1 Tax=Metarhizium rileyi (strain RCEF 4871) TaxID=1649241 RepID=A0A5C6GFQ5_METRR|nr:hypothetical protein ED733_005369 [Metarhizium rileyi]